MPLSHITLQDFKVDRLAFEVRYDPAYLHWDRAGGIWTQALGRWPKLKNVKGEPGITTFILENRYTLSISIDRTTVVDSRPHRVPQDLVQIADPFLELVTKKLEINSYARVGVRPIYVKAYDKSSESAEAFFSMNVVRFPTGPHFGIDAEPHSGEYVVRWEGKSLGATLRVKSEQRKYELDPPPRDSI
jgi:hypothetical protein